MIKAAGTTEDNRLLLVLGLSFANLDRLRAGDPITFDGLRYGYPGVIHIFAGRDEETMAAMLKRDNPDVLTFRERNAP